jgi:hypothetical protein
MSYLLGFGLNDNLLDAVFRAYPRIWSAVDSDFSEGKTPIESAVGVLVIAFTNEIEQHLPFAERVRAERYILQNEGEPKSTLEKGLKTFLVQVLTQKDLGRVSDFLYTYAITEVIGALRGTDSRERMAQRIVRPLLQPSGNG